MNDIDTRIINALNGVSSDDAIKSLCSVLCAQLAFLHKTHAIDYFFHLGALHKAMKSTGEELLGTVKQRKKKGRF